METSVSSCSVSETSQFHEIPNKETQLMDLTNTEKRYLDFNKAFGKWEDKNVFSSLLHNM